jgi:hypothetical protein
MNMNKWLIGIIFALIGSVPFVSADMIGGPIILVGFVIAVALAVGFVVGAVFLIKFIVRKIKNKAVTKDVNKNTIDKK